MTSPKKIRARLSLWRYLPRVLRFARRWRFHALVGVIAWVVSALLSLLYPLALGRFIDRVLQQGRLDALPALIVFVAAVILLRAGTDILRTFFLSRARESTTAEARLDLHDRVLRAPLPLIEKHKSAALHDRVMRDLDAVMGLLFNSGPRFIQATCLAVGAAAVALAQDWRLSLTGMLFLPPFLLIMLIWVRRLRPRYKALWERRSQLGATFQQHYAGARVLQAFNRQGWAVEQARAEQEELADATVRLQRESALVATAPSVVIGAGLVALLYIGARRVEAGPLTGGELTAIIGVLAILAGSVASVVALANTIQQSLASAERVFEIADMAPRRDSFGPPTNEALEPQVLKIEALTFSYPAREESDQASRPVLEDLSFEVPAGQTAALVGLSGAGKTTTASLLARFLEPDAGRVLWGEADIDAMPLAQWRANIAIVHQEDWLLAAGVRDNLALGRENMDDARLWEALETVRAADLVRSLPQGLDTEVGERGHDLSGGERQRLCLARAILGRPGLLILDEATAALDLQTEHEIFRNLRELPWHPSVLLISHRLTAIAAAQTIHVLHDGRIVESGSHDELMETGSHYRRMLHLQKHREAGV